MSLMKMMIKTMMMMMMIVMMKMIIFLREEAKNILRGGCSKNGGSPTFTKNGGSVDELGTFFGGKR